MPGRLFGDEVSSLRLSSAPGRILVALALALLPTCHGAVSGPGSRVTIPVTYTINTLDPGAEIAFGTHEVAANIYEPLCALGREMEIHPWLASSWESPDNLTWVFHLRRDVRFQSGRPFTARDVVFSVRRLLEDHSLRSREILSNVLSAEATDDHTVVLRTSVPQFLLLSKLSLLLVVPADSTKEWLRDHADGSGPYRLSEWQKDWVRLERNDGYWGEKPSIREADIRLAASHDDALAGTLSGRYQMMLSHQRDVTSLVSANPDLRVIRHENPFVRYLGFDHARSETPYCAIRPNPFRDIRVRRAIHLAIDRKRLIAGLPVSATPASQLVAPAILGFDPTIRESAPHLEEARSLLKAAGLEKGFDVTLRVAIAFRYAAEGVARELAPLGIRVTIEALPTDKLYDALEKHDVTFWLAGAGSVSGDGEDLLADFIHSPDPERRLGLRNFGGFRDPAVDAAIERISEEPDPHLRLQGLQTLMRELMRDHLPWVPLYRDEDSYVIHKSLAWLPRNDGYIRVAEIREGAPPSAGTR